LDDRLAPNGRGHNDVTFLLNFAYNDIFGVGETKDFKCRLLIDAEGY